jgi:hypothetical protein
MLSEETLAALQVIGEEREQMIAQQIRSPCEGCDASEMCKPDKKGCPKFKKYFVKLWDDTVHKIQEELHERAET